MNKLYHFCVQYALEQLDRLAEEFVMMTVLLILAASAAAGCGVLGLVAERPPLRFICCRGLFWMTATTIVVALLLVSGPALSDLTRWTLAIFGLLSTFATLAGFGIYICWERKSAALYTASE